MAGIDAGSRERGSPAKRGRGKGADASAGTPGEARTPKALASRSKPELYNIARGLKINGRSTMTKEDLIAAIDTRAR